MTNGNLPMNYKTAKIEYLSEEQLNTLTQAFMDYYDKSIKYRKARGKYWLTYLFLRFTGARLNEVLSINDNTDVDFRNSEVKLVTLKQRNKTFRIVPLPNQVISELATYLAQYPSEKGKVFKILDCNFRRRFYLIGEKAGLPKNLSHPHILRHTRAIELLRAGVPVTAVQALLGHSSLTTTAIYLRLSGQEIKWILKEKGLI
ncbi:MAG: site-specific integrase [Desulfurella sp.]|nr:MAG: site-specific integrase [Desulfurella sp.]